jgi:hypothetical protein
MTSLFRFRAQEVATQIQTQLVGAFQVVVLGHIFYSSPGPHLERSVV